MTTNIFLRSQIRATLKNANSPTFSLIRMRVRVLGERLTIFLPAECRVKPCHWDATEGKTIVNPKRNYDIKGDPSLLLQGAVANAPASTQSIQKLWKLQSINLGSRQGR